jgi:hypothetical protein
MMPSSGRIAIGVTLADALDGSAGHTVEERIGRTDLRPGLALLDWTERDGTHVMDSINFKRGDVHADFVMPNETRGRNWVRFAS